ncbi:MAG: MBL fold metallo-hydrolase [Proteobacteria bacterium]|nr:MBL fold metallo-hydrolase [Pseudomonadota bacterium]
MVEIAPRVRRLIAPNPGPFTFTGTCTYIVGEGRVAVIDPGPDDPVHLATLREALAGEDIAQIIVTHTHRDHSPGAAPLKALTGAPVLGCGPHRAARPLHPGETAMEAGVDRAYAPDRIIADGETIEGDGYSLTALATPGHTANHLCFTLDGGEILFSGDHVMAWSTTVVAPPDGSMRDFMASLDLLKQRPEGLFLPGHGGPVKTPARFVRALIHHRRMREATIIERVRSGDATISVLVGTVYEKLDPRLIGGASMSILAHLEDLVARGILAADGPPSLTAVYRPA